jgi:hypothetical protein
LPAFSRTQQKNEEIPIPLEEEKLLNAKLENGMTNLVRDGALLPVYKWECSRVIVEYPDENHQGNIQTDTGQSL